MTALQWIVKEAKSIKKQYPKRFAKWTDYVAQASAIYAKKHKGKSPVGKKKAVKKKAAKKKVSGVKDSKAVKTALAKKGLKMPHGYQTIKRKRKIGSVKKKRVSEQSILNKIHKVKNEVNSLDELQHKHMSVMGAVNKHALKQYEELLSKIHKVEKHILAYTTMAKNMAYNLENRKSFKLSAAKWKKYLSELKTHAKELKKHI